MLDTVKLRSPYLSEDVARAVERHLERRLAISNATLDVIYDFTSGPLQGTWDHRIRVQVERTEWVRVDKLAERLGGRSVRPTTVPEKRDCPPYLVVEGSIHKALLGHNVYGGPCDLAAPVRWFVAGMSDRLGVALPNGDLWQLRRIDWAHIYDLGSFEAVQEWVGYMHNVRYPRRKVSRYEDESLSVSGTTSTVKLYHKGPEFTKHDRSRVARYIDVGELQERANTLLRCEVEIHARTIDEEYSHAGGATVDRITVQWIEDLYDRDVGRLIREGASDVRTVRTAAAVKRRLYATYTEPQARALYGTWLELAAMGEKSVRGSLRRATFYDHRKKLQLAGCSWHDTNVKIDDRVRLVPEDFAPLRSDPRRTDAELPEVAVALAPYRRAS